MRKKKSQKSIIGVGWYKKEQWQMLREISEDGDNLEDTYYEWIVNANDSITKLSKSGCRFAKIEVDIQELLEWCSKQKLAVNGESRANFIALKTKEKFQ